MQLAALSRRERQLTQRPQGHILTNIGVWSHDGQWLVYDTRSDATGERFDGARIERVHVQTGEVQLLYASDRGAHCGAATCSPVDDRVAFILGPEDPTPDWQYSAWHRQGVIVSASEPGMALPLDARELVQLRPGALRGGSHVHVFSPDGRWVSFTYEDHLLAQFAEPTATRDVNLRQIGVSVPDRAVSVSRAHPRNHDGQFFSVVVTRAVARPRPGSDEICRACEEAWVGTHGYLRADGARQARALAFQGDVVTEDQGTIREAFIVDLPDDLTQAGDAPLEGTPRRAPAPPRGTTQRRLTHTAGRRFPGLQGPRHWLRSSPDGSRIALLMKDETGVVQLWTVSPHGGITRQLTHNVHGIASAFSWSSDGQWLAHALDNSVCATNAATGQTRRLTERSDDATAPRPEACVFSPDDRQIAFVRTLPMGERRYNQICVVPLDAG